jgi:exonuclease SbcC
MRPLTLTLNAFGPFAGEQRVDFTRTGLAPFLLINGPTGAGKTSLLDGLCFALYGKASGEAREKQNDKYLRSQLARPEDECVVRLSFQVGERRFLVERKPTQDVASRGKTVERKHRVEFCEIGADGQVLGERLSKVGEVDQRIEELVGFTCEQFRQVMVLPQGEFRRLLLAKSDEKEKILQKLFGAGKYKLVEEALKRRRAELERLLGELSAGMEAILSSKGVAGVGELEERLAACAAMERERGAERDAARLALAQAQAAEAQAQAVDRDFSERAQAAEALGVLQAGQPEAEAAERRAGRAFKALEHADLEAAIARGEEEARQRAQVLQRLAGDIDVLNNRRAAAAQAVAQAQAGRDRIPELAAEQERLSARLAQLKERDTAARQAAQARKAEAEARDAAVQAAQRLAAVDRRLEELAKGIEGLAQQVGDAARLDLDISRLQRLLEQRAQLDRLLAERGAAESGLAAAQAREAACAGALATARQERQEAQRALLAGQAAHLAATLAEGQPCPVCGSLEHPAPAAGGQEAHAEQALARAEAAEQRAEKNLEQARAAAGQARENLARMDAGMGQLAQSLGEAAEGRDMAGELAKARADKERLAGLVQRLERSRAERDTLATQRPELLAVQASADERRAAAAAELAAGQALLERAGAAAGTEDSAAVQARLDELARLIPAAERAFQSAQKEHADIETRLSALQGQGSALEQAAQDASALLAGQRQTFERRLLTDGFMTIQEYREARLPRPEAEALRKRAAAFRESLAAASDRLARAEAACADRVRPDLGALVLARQEAATVADRLSRELGELAQRGQELREALAAIGEKAGRAAELEAQYRVAGHLADLAAGKNPERMTLQRYVLAALFEEVAVAASQRLLRMSRGRYRLARALAVHDGRSTGGLDLDVEDAHTGETRPASTLSGGESFLASLALALGLSDVVMAQQGGRRLDCIFIDEGFGSLDGETLEYALNTLMELHSAGRLIGIISHVAELKERIDARIDVLPSKGGSSIRQVNC